MEAAGGGLKDIIELTRYMADQATNQDGANGPRPRHLGDHWPASTSVEVVRSTPILA